MELITTTLAVKDLIRVLFMYIYLYFVHIFWTYCFQSPVYCPCAICALTANCIWICRDHNKRLFGAKKSQLFLTHHTMQQRDREYTAATMLFLHFHRHSGSISGDCFPLRWVAFCLHVPFNSGVFLSTDSRQNIRYEQTTFTLHTFVIPTFNNERQTGYTNVCVSSMLTVS